MLGKIYTVEQIARAKSREIKQNWQISAEIDNHLGATLATSRPIRL